MLLVEDSIVRSTTLQDAAATTCATQGGAKEIHVRVACPPIIAPCFYGIDMSTVTELFAPSLMAGIVPTVAEQEAMAHELGADTLFYLPLDAVARCIELPPEPLCRACLTGEYPTPTGEQLYQLSLRTKSEEGRTYEAGIPVTGALIFHFPLCSGWKCGYHRTHPIRNTAMDPFAGALFAGLGFIFIIMMTVLPSILMLARARLRRCACAMRRPNTPTRNSA